MIKPGDRVVMRRTSMEHLIGKTGTVGYDYKPGMYQIIWDTRPPSFHAIHRFDLIANMTTFDIELQAYINSELNR